MRGDSSQYNCLSVEFLYSTSAKSAIWLAELLVHYQLSLLLTHTPVATENGRRSVQWVAGASVMDRRRPQICSNTNLVGAISTFPPVNMDRIGLPMAPQTFHVRFPVLVNHAKWNTFVIDVESQYWQGILTDTVHGCSGVSYSVSHEARLGLTAEYPATWTNFHVTGYAVRRK